MITTIRRLMVVRTGRSVAVALVGLVLLTGCASTSGGRTDNMKRADAYARANEWDNAITYYQRVIDETPDDRNARSQLVRAQANASQAHRVEADKAARAGDLQTAQLELELAVRLDNTNKLAVDRLADVTVALEEQRATREEARSSIQRDKERSNLAASPVPILAHDASGPMSFDYRAGKMKQIYRAVGELGGINVLFDPDLRNDDATFFLQDVEYEEALHVLTAMHGHFFQVMSPNTILISEDSQQKRRQYSPLVMRTFYLSNAEAEQVSGALQTILGARQVMPDPSLNAVTMRDTAEVVEVAERMIANLDKARGEVLLNVELFELDRNVMEDYGMSLSDYGTTLAVNQPGSGDNGPAGISLEGLGKLTTADAFITIPSLRYQFMKQNTSFRLIAQPQLRASDGQASQLLVGEQRPIVTTTFNPSNTSGGDVIPISTTEYRDVGIVIQATPRVHHDGMITLQLGVEVTAVQEGSGAEGQPVFTARTLTTTLRLQEGETNLLAGLLRDDERTTYTGVPILSDIPILKDLFGRTERDVLQTDIVMSITPYIVRMADIDYEDLEAVYVGTENAIGGGGGGGRRGGRGGNNNANDEEGSGRDLTDPVQVAISPASTFASVGERISVDITASGSGSINNAGMRVNWNSQVLRMIEIREGSMLGSDGSPTSFTSNQAGGGTAAIGIGRVGAVGGVTPTGVLATIEFECIALGESQVQLVSAALRDAAGRPVAVEFEQAAVTVDR
jgi:general secretion pathway protein D